jgi:hypothetical protein
MGPKPKPAASRTTKPALAAPPREPRPSTRNAMIGVGIGVLMMAAGLFLHRPPPVGASHWVRENGQYSWDSGADPVTQRLNVVLGCGALLAVLSGALSVQLSREQKAWDEEDARLRDVA